MSAEVPTIAHVDAETGWSGGQVQVFLLMQGLAARGFSNLLCCQPGSRMESEARAIGIDVALIPMRVDGQLTAIPRLRRAFRKHGVGLVHLHTGRANFLGGLAAFWARLPMITTRRQDGRVQRHPFNLWFYRSLVGRAVAISDAVATQLAAGGVPTDRILVIPSTVDAESMRPAHDRASVRAALGIDNGRCVLLSLASLHARKGLDVLIRALAALSDRTSERPLALIAGEGPESETLAALVTAEGLEDDVRFLGRRSDTADLLGACDVAVVPSRREGLGISALEAMAAGRPIVASEVGGLAQAVVHEQTGLLVPPDDPAALAEALETLVTDRALRERLGAAGPAHVARSFAPDAMVTAYAELYGALGVDPRVT